MRGDTEDDDRSQADQEVFLRWASLNMLLGSWDIWLSTQWSPAEGSPPPGNVGFETEHYELDVTIARRKLLLQGNARLHMRAEDTGRRVVRLELARDLRVSAIHDDQQQELYFFRRFLP